MYGTVVNRVSDPDPDWIRFQSGQWIRIRIQEGKNDPQKWGKNFLVHVLKVWMVSFMSCRLLL